MRYHCACTLSFEEEVAEIFEGVTGHMVHCPACGGLVAEIPYDEEETTVIPTKFLPNEDQCNYLTHLCQKQIVKLAGAKSQLEDLITKTDILKEMARERAEVTGGD